MISIIALSAVNPIYKNNVVVGKDVKAENPHPILLNPDAVEYVSQYERDDSTAGPADRVIENFFTIHTASRTFHVDAENLAILVEAMN